MRVKHLKWGSYSNVIDPVKETPGSLIEAVLLYAYLIIWSLAMAAYIGVFVLTVAATLLLVLFWLPCFLWSRVSSKAKPPGPRQGPRARLLGSKVTGRSTARSGD